MGRFVRLGLRVLTIGVQRRDDPVESATNCRNLRDSNPSHHQFVLHTLQGPTVHIRSDLGLVMIKIIVFRGLYWGPPMWVGCTCRFIGWRRFHVRGKDCWWPASCSVQLARIKGLYWEPQTGNPKSIVGI